MSEISVIGLGAMGSALAQALQQSGHELTVWNRSTEKMKPFIANGATGAASVYAAVVASPVILVCVDNYATTQGLLGSDGVVSHLSGRTLIQLGTGTPREVQECAIWCNEHNVTYIDGAILCLPTGVGTEDAQFLFAGPESAFGELDPLLKCLGGDRRYLGENIRAAATLDLAWLSQRFGQIIEMFPEGDRVQILANAIKGEDYADPDVTVAVWKAVSHRFQEQARDAGISSEFPDFAAGIVKRAMDAGYGGEDVAALVKVFRER
jgi:3-hydroxyisobutyrate dehydrogenase-like beta-hydroxyacid dehydrogenase